MSCARSPAAPRSPASPAPALRGSAHRPAHLRMCSTCMCACVCSAQAPAREGSGREAGRTHGRRTAQPLQLTEFLRDGAADRLEAGPHRARRSRCTQSVRITVRHAEGWRAVALRWSRILASIALTGGGAVSTSVGTRLAVADLHVGSGVAVGHGVVVGHVGAPGRIGGRRPGTRGALCSGPCHARRQSAVRLLDAGHRRTSAFDARVDRGARVAELAEHASGRGSDASGRGGEYGRAADSRGRSDAAAM